MYILSEIQGFSGEFERVKNLPCGGTHAFTVKFNPQEAKLKMGHRSVLLPIQVQRAAFWLVCANVAFMLTGGLSLLLTDFTRWKVAGAAVCCCN